jgi:hypothetical protein
VLRPDQLQKLKEAVDEFVELAEDVIEQRLEQQENDAGRAEMSVTNVLILPARGAFDQAASKLMVLAGRLDARAEVTLAAGSGLMGINAALQDRAAKDFKYAAIVSVGEATPPQLRLLIRRLRRARAVPIGILVGKDSSGEPRIEAGRFWQAEVFATAKALLDRIRANVERCPPASSSAAPVRPIASAKR